jgi:hypothetical protein
MTGSAVARLFIVSERRITPSARATADKSAPFRLRPFLNLRLVSFRVSHPGAENRHGRMGKPDQFLEAGMTIHRLAVWTHGRTE